MVRDDGVTPVMANVLMVAVLLAVSVGIYLLLAEFEDVAESPDRRQGSFSVDRGPGDQEFHLLYVRGSPILLDNAVLRVTIDGAEHVHEPLSDTATVQAGAHWNVGESLCIVGAGTCLHPSGTTVMVWLEVEGDVMFRAERDLRP